MTERSHRTWRSCPLPTALSTPSPMAPRISSSTSPATSLRNSFGPLLQCGLKLSYIPSSNRRTWFAFIPCLSLAILAAGGCRKSHEEDRGAGGEKPLANCLAFAETLGGDRKGPELSGSGNRLNLI